MSHPALSPPPRPSRTATQVSLLGGWLNLSQQRACLEYLYNGPIPIPEDEKDFEFLMHFRCKKWMLDNSKDLPVALFRDWFFPIFCTDEERKTAGWSFTKEELGAVMEPVGLFFWRGWGGMDFFS